MQAQPEEFGCGRLVLLEVEMPESGKSVNEHNGQDYIEDSESEEDGVEELKKAKHGSDEVHSSVGPVGVEGHVEGEEIVNVLVLLIHQ